MKKQRIYIIISTFHPLVGGAETQALAQGRAIQERGHDATIITFRHQKEWPRREIIEGVPVIRIAGFLLGEREKQSRFLQKVLYLLALVVLGWTLWQRRHRFDLLHVYQLSLLALPTSVFARLAGKPLLISVRSTGSGQKREADAAASLLAGPLDPTLPWLRIDGQTWVDGDLESLLRMGRLVTRFTYRQLQALHAKVIILSSRMKGYLTANDFLLPHTQLIPNGVNTARFKPAAEPIPFAQRAQTVVCVSKLRYEKGIDVLLQAWHLVQKELPTARLILVGSGPIQQQLMAMAEALGITASVEFAGLQRDIPAQLYRGGLAILPSRWEGMPNAVLEAMACGLPCIATRVSGSEDIIEHGVNGLQVDIEDYRTMAQALLTLLRDPALTQRYGEAALATIQQRYSLDYIAETYMELYANMTGSHPSTQPTNSDFCHSPSK